MNRSEYEYRISTRSRADPAFKPIVLLQFQDRAFGSTETHREAAVCRGSLARPEVRDRVSGGVVQTGTPYEDCGYANRRNRGFAFELLAVP